MESIKSWYYSKPLIFFIAAILSVCALCYFGLGFSYYQAKEDFVFEITASDTVNLNTLYEPTQAKVVYIDYTDQNQTDKDSRQILHFEIEDTTETIYIKMNPDIASKINLISGERYHLTFQIMFGWPSSYGLMITDKNNELVFLGITDGDLKNVIELYDLSPIEVVQSRVLTSHFMPSKGCISKLTNTEIQFAQDGKTITLHQGQSASLNNYEIELRIARKVNYTNKCYDVGMNELSFVIYRMPTLSK